MNTPREPGSPPPADPHPTEPSPTDRLVGGRYRLGPIIGRGGMATIHRALDTRLDRLVAVKLLRPEVSRDPDLAQRFRREALAATVLRHPNIVACLDTGTDGDQPYLIMELVDGEDLAARLRRGGRLAPWAAARIGLDVARGLGVAHTRGIVHRDVKPGNILLAADGRAMVTDFGIARLAADAEASVAGTTLGSVHYFSPEQARGHTTTPASDVYGLGLVLFETLTGRRAWTGDTTDAIALARVGARPPSPRATIPEVPAALEAVVIRALAPDAADRYPSGAAMASALEPIVAASDPATPTTIVAVPTPVAARDVVPSGEPAAREPGSDGIAASGASSGADAAPPSAAAPPLVPPSVARAAHRTAGAAAAPAAVPARGRQRPGIAAAVLGSVGLVLVAMLVAALPAGGDPSGSRTDEAAVASVAPTVVTPTATPDPTADPTPDATATPDATPDPTADPTADPTPEPDAVPDGSAGDVCETFFGLPCGLGAGRYAPSRFAPAFSIEIGDGWSTALHDADLVSFVRDEGGMTFASDIVEVYPDGEPTGPRDRARDLIEAFIATEAVGSTRPADLRLDGRKGQSIDVTPVDGVRVTLFRTVANTFYLEPDRTTRIVVLDVRGRAVILAIEPAEGRDLRDILDTADVAAGTIDWH